MGGQGLDNITKGFKLNWAKMVALITKRRLVNW